MSDPSGRVDETLERLAAPAAALRPDWHDVLSRAGRARRRSAAFGIVGVISAVVVVSTAFAVVPRLLKPNQLAFMRTVHLPPTDAPAAVRKAFVPHRFAGAPRRAVSLRTGRGRMTLWVSSHRGGGWCQGLQRPREQLWVTCTWWKARYGAFGAGLVGPDLFVGRAATSKGRRLLLVFGNGTRVRIPTTDGFFLFQPAETRLLRAAPRALILLDREHTVARLRLPNLYGGPGLLAPMRRPGGADVRREQRILVAHGHVGPVSIFVSPSRFARATCWWLQVRRAAYGGGCVGSRKDTSSMWSAVPDRLGVRGHEVDVLWGRAGRKFTRLDLRFQDGHTIELPRKRSFFLYLVPGPERARGHRPAILIGRGARGKTLRREPLYAFTWAP